MHFKIAITIAVVMLVAACATQRPSWHKSGVSPDDAQSALAQCKYDVGMNKVADQKEATLVQSCMESKGFRWSVN